MGSKHKMYTYDRKKLNHFVKLSNVIDVNLLHYMSTGNPLDLEQLDTTAHNFLNMRYYKKENINTIIPVLKHLEKCRKISKILKIEKIAYSYLYSLMITSTPSATSYPSYMYKCGVEKNLCCLSIIVRL